MALGNKLSKLRRENNITQEQLAQKMGVSRQAISKWESDATFPETDKLIYLSELYNCSLDYLLKDKEEEKPAASEPKQNKGLTINIGYGFSTFERKSSKTLFGLPLWHICIDPKKTAKGVFAVGFRAKGIFSAGLLSVGVVSFGLLSLGVFALGALALGLIAAGAFAAGIVAFGAICFGLLSVGAIAVGEFSVGALARGHYFALGDDAKAMVALGKTTAEGSVYEFVGEKTPVALRAAMDNLEQTAPRIYRWIVRLISVFTG